MDEKGFTASLGRNISTRDVLQKSQTYLLQNYARADLVLERGNGVYVFDNDGERYLDCVSGLAVNALGHGDYDVLEVIREQSATLIHVSNLYHTIPGALLAEQLVKKSFADRVFFCNSGTEAIEAALKFARRWGRTTGGDEKVQLVTTERSFHGRTMGAVSLTGQTKYQEPFHPLMPGVKTVPYNDIEAMVAAIDDNTAAVFLEPIQAEGGVHPATKEYLSAVREACDNHKALLVFDEVQVGMGRTGTLWAHEHYGITPDIMTLAKPLGGGIPVGATLMTQDVADTIKPGDHASTFGGGPLVASVGLVVLEKVSDPELLQSVRENGERFRERLEEMRSHHAMIRDIRGRGLIWGIELDRPAAQLVAALRKRHTLACIAGPNVLRFLPPLVISDDQLHQVADQLNEAMTEVEAQTQQNAV
jgi:predicted acetylornithine/succinylornithine family transaminase